jgi:acetolactate synthase-1/2/3 large subunit
VAQQLQVKRNQSVHMSAGHGSMGYSLPAAIGSYYVNKRPVFSFNGDGGIQMNIQELQYLKRERIPVHVIIINNHALGMIRGFQEANFNKNYTQTIEGSGYLAPDFLKIAEAYSLQYIQISSSNDIEKMSEIDLYKPSIIELTLPVETALNPNFGANGMIQDQRPYMDRKLFDSLMSL